MGRSAYSRRAFEARNRHRRDQREQIHGASEETALADLEDLSCEPCKEYGFDRLLYRADDQVSGPVCASGAGTRCLCIRLANSTACSVSIAPIDDPRTARPPRLSLYLSSLDCYLQL